MDGVDRQAPRSPGGELVPERGGREAPPHAELISISLVDLD